MMTRTGLPAMTGRTTALAAIMALGLALSPGPAAAEGAPTGTMAVGTIAAQGASATDFSAARRHRHVRRHRGGNGAAAAAAFAGMVGIIGAIAADQARRDSYYYGAPYGYYGGGPYYYGSSPRYYRPAYHHHRHFRPAYRGGHFHRR